MTDESAKPGDFWRGIGSVVAIVLAFSIGEAGCASEEVCGSGADEDGDGFVDCFDNDCWVAGVCPELCTSIFDEDGDGQVGCLDRDCWVADGACEEVCDSSEDEDGDGVTGCDDSDCWVDGGTCDELCDSENDEDGDGLAGCLDSDCWVAAAGCAEVCDSENDEDADGSTDCDDADCAFNCQEVADEVMCTGDLLCAPTYAEDIRPIMDEHCVGPTANCHSNMMALGGLSVQRYDDMLLPSIFCPNSNKGGVLSVAHRGRHDAAELCGLRACGPGRCDPRLDRRRSATLRRNGPEQRVLIARRPRPEGGYGRGERLCEGGDLNPHSQSGH